MLERVNESDLTPEELAVFQWVTDQFTEEDIAELDGDIRLTVNGVLDHLMFAPGFPIDEASFDRLAAWLPVVRRTRVGEAIAR